MEKKRQGLECIHLHHRFIHPRIGQGVKKNSAKEKKAKAFY